MRKNFLIQTHSTKTHPIKSRLVLICALLGLIIALFMLGHSKSIHAQAQNSQPIAFQPNTEGDPWAEVSGASFVYPPTQQIPELKSAQPVPFFPDFIRYFDASLQAAEVPGGALAIVRANQIEHIHTFGVRSLTSQQPVTPETVFRIASVSKTFAAGLAAQLEAKRRFSWQDPITQYIPQFSLADTEATQQIQIQHLLAHSAGIVPNAYDNLIEANYSSEQILPYFKSLTPLCQPGTCYGYQNVLFNLITDVVELSTGKSYQSLLTENIFEPLGMRHASIGYEGYMNTENKASPHIKGKNTWFERQVTPHYYHFPAAAGVNASAQDLAQWLIAQLGYYEEVFSFSLLDTIRQPRVRTTRDLRRRDWRHLLTNAHYALGWRLYELGQEQIVYHGGWVSGFRASLAYSPEHEIGVVILLNAESHVISQIATTFWSDIFPRMQQEQQIPYFHAHSSAASQKRTETGQSEASLPYPYYPALHAQPFIQ